MAFPCDESPATLSDISSKDTNRIVGNIARTLAANSVYINLIQGGTFPSGVSDTIRSVVQMQAAPGDSLAIPQFVCDTEICGQQGKQALTDTISHVTRLESFRERGPNVCVKQGFAAFKGSYNMAVDSLKKLVVQYINADVRGQLYLRGGTKFVANADFDFNSLLTGGTDCSLGVLFAPILPTGPITFKALHYIARYMRDVLLAEWFASDKGMPHFRFIAGSDQIEYLRSEVGVQNIMIALTTGGYKLGEVALTAFSFEQSAAYRGIAFAVDQRPLRATGFNPDGTLALVDPITIVSNPAKGTAYAVANPAWLDAPYEVGTLIADMSFERLVPERYVGEGEFKFAPQLHMGELEWHYQLDNGCNTWGDFGHHKFQITRAYKPIRPQWIVHILYKRCLADLGLVNCVDTDSSSFSGADSFVSVGTCPVEPCWDTSESCSQH